MIQQKITYPQWYRSMRAFLLGASFGVILFSALQQLGKAPSPLPTFPGSMILLFTQMPVALVLAVFEIGFEIARYRNLCREIDGRSVVAHANAAESLGINVKC